MLWIRRRPARESGVRHEAETVVFEPEGGAARREAPTIRIFLGTEPAQFRAERAFVWSVARHRDRGRRYEVHLMKDLAGFDRSGWTTGFTNYRFAVPHLAGATGRAIYNDVDQVYLSDPAELFDADMDGHAVLATSPAETSVMVMDCARMAEVWSMEAARSQSETAMLARMNAIPGLRGDLDPRWNARDEEYVEGASKLLRFTTPHTRPWMPEPRRFVYHGHPQGHIWGALEREADAADFKLFTRDRPSRRFRELLAYYRHMHVEGSRADRVAPEQIYPGRSIRRHIEVVGGLVRETGAVTLLDYGAGKGMVYQALTDHPPAHPVKRMPAWGEDVRVRLYDPAFAPHADLPPGRFDGVVSTDVLEHIPEEDVPWVVDELFTKARRFVYAAVACYPAKATLPNGENAHCSAKDPVWWEERFKAAARHHPEVHWVMVARVKNWRGRKRTLRRSGGAPLGDRQRTVWVLADTRKGNANQAEGLAQALGEPYQVKPMRYGPLAGLHNRLLGASRAGLAPAAAAALAPPWPDLVIAAGRRTAPVARWIGRKSGGQTRIVQLGRKGGHAARHFDAAITPRHCHLPASDRRIETLLPITPMKPRSAASAGGVSAPPLEDVRRPMVVALVGGATERHRFDAETARKLAADLVRFSEAEGGTPIVLTSRRTGTSAAEALSRAVGDAGRVIEPAAIGDHYWTVLAAADALVVTGESESLIADAAALGKPLYIYPLPEKPWPLRLKIGAWIEERACVRPPKNRGTTRPQRGLDYLCARLLERGYVRPPRWLGELHETLYACRLAKPFGAPRSGDPPPPRNEVEQVAAEVRYRLGWPPSRDRTVEPDQSERDTADEDRLAPALP